MRVNFTVHETPRPKTATGKKTYHARVKPTGTKYLEDICEHINEVSSLTSADVKGALEAFFKYVSSQLRAGYNVELDGLGNFSVALRSYQRKSKNGRNISSVEIDGVNFRCSPRLKNAVKNTRLKKVKRPVKAFPNIAQRQARMVEYLEKYGTINQRDYATLNACSRYYATKDLKTFHEQGLIARSGGGTHKVYLLVG
ncbi:putative histone-like DNA-binding protein [Parabacteroides sp. PF5-5]|uniref:HU family DNA-binding protein n=1 Tax=unclassified Parabacteroides TaxID=2649774 RepID=UPI002473CEC4|nr:MULTISPECIES: HU family DNA-binding protein [unclassified Parabacteroides]MDH6304857.1 putative histone-like DNA-binding protein [Parabacteroides sp. PH5-39]MDH6316057.1 putative histone-like DNA-binding protein [Parabacteroides sp. PF5-13]MDH6319714.1 putative histone-like DNA-binding protein [Parabacteroides sp. PH5-13]MDH6323445.1 putative histone-like DNA-binding protein [Parabacteroides sp. PH5-8]MDH6327047.1 putative histone-like DNA-binding protein [Parabacteroides sp. PH5-41]